MMYRLFYPSHLLGDRPPMEATYLIAWTLEDLEQLTLEAADRLAKERHLQLIEAKRIAYRAEALGEIAGDPVSGEDLESLQQDVRVAMAEYLRAVKDLVEAKSVDLNPLKARKIRIDEDWLEDRQSIILRDFWGDPEEVRAWIADDEMYVTDWIPAQERSVLSPAGRCGKLKRDREGRHSRFEARASHGRDRSSSPVKRQTQFRSRSTSPSTLKSGSSRSRPSPKNSEEVIYSRLISEHQLHPSSPAGKEDNYPERLALSPEGSPHPLSVSGRSCRQPSQGSSSDYSASSSSSSSCHPLAICALCGRDGQNALTTSEDGPGSESELLYGNCFRSLSGSESFVEQHEGSRANPIVLSPSPSPTHRLPSVGFLDDIAQTILGSSAGHPIPVSPTLSPHGLPISPAQLNPEDFVRQRTSRGSSQGSLATNGICTIL